MLIALSALLSGCLQTPAPHELPPASTLIVDRNQVALITYAFSNYLSTLHRDPYWVVGPLEDSNGADRTRLVKVERLLAPRDLTVAEVYRTGPRKREILAIGSNPDTFSQDYTLALTLFDKFAVGETMLHTPYTFTDIHLHAIDGVPRYRYVWDGEYYRREAVAPPEETPSTTRAASGDGRP